MALSAIALVCRGAANEDVAVAALVMVVALSEVIDSMMEAIELVATSVGEAASMLEAAGSVEMELTNVAGSVDEAGAAAKEESARLSVAYTLLSSVTAALGSAAIEDGVSTAMLLCP